MIILASLESAGEVTLGTLFGYVQRHGWLEESHYLGAPHVRIESQQVAQIREVAPAVMTSDNSEHIELVHLVFDALTTMFRAGGDRYYREFLSTTN